MDSTVFINAINAATSPVMIGLYLGGLMFCLGFIPAAGARVITAGLSPVD